MMATIASRERGDDEDQGREHPGVPPPKIVFTQGCKFCLQASLMSGAWPSPSLTAQRWVAPGVPKVLMRAGAAERGGGLDCGSLDLRAVPGSELFLFQTAISGKNAAISPPDFAVSGFRRQK